MYVIIEYGIIIFVRCFLIKELNKINVIFWLIIIYLKINNNKYNIKLYKYCW